MLYKFATNTNVHEFLLFEYEIFVGIIPTKMHLYCFPHKD